MAGVTQSSVGVSVKIPPDWLHEPRFPNRSDLLEARRLERRQLALSAAQREPTLGGGNEGRSRFARSETIFRDSFRKSGAFDLSGQPPLSPTHFHARATCSGLVTRTACLNQRHEQRRVESLAFEPHEIMRLRDIPKAEQLREWWKQPREGYEVDPAATVCANSLRLDLARRGLELGPMDPGKVRSPASVDERRRLKQQKALLANSVHRITHSIPAAYLKGNRADTATIARAPDLYAQERPESGREGGGAGGGGTSGITHGALTRAGSLPPAFPLVSPVKDPDARQPCRRPDRPTRLSIESLFLESTSQRAQLDQIKACSPLASPGHQVLGGNGTEGGRGWASALPTDSQFTSSPNQSVGGDARHGAVRCGGFA
ncbi:hypothetical protein PybrP1_002596 [[Pythium] brassicae (nom. inval.)]|nr:hypothetical protein PybrP1_002596 [[Pythium] brassicae (nom. inval.)]